MYGNSDLLLLNRFKWSRSVMAPVLLSTTLAVGLQSAAKPGESDTSGPVIRLLYLLLFHYLQYTKVNNYTQAHIFVGFCAVVNLVSVK